jgi:alpha-tubulin suppressor-like RCC1 family protein
MIWGPSAFAEDVSFVSLATGYHHMCGIATSGAAFCWGFNDDGQLGNGLVSEEFDENETRVSGGLTFTSLTAGVSHTCGVAADGKAYCWGLNNRGQLGNGTKTDSRVPVPVSGGLLFESLSAGNLHTCGVTTAGEVFCWGHNDRIGGRDGSDGGVGPSGKSEHTEPWRVLQVPGDERFPWRKVAR